MELGYTCTGAAGASVTKLLGPTKWTYYYLYNILDVLSRYPVRWLITERESASLAEELIAAYAGYLVHPSGSVRGVARVRVHKVSDMRLIIREHLFVKWSAVERKYK